MLKVIEPQEQDFYKHTINSFLNLLKSQQDFELSSKERSKATFIIAEDEQQGVYGGTLLYRQQTSKFHEKLARIILSLQPEMQSLWSARLCFYIKDEEEIFTLDRLSLYQTFYLDLYKAFAEFGAQKELDFLALTLHYRDYRNIQTYGYWPYLLEVRPHDTPDGYFHGLLDVGRKKDKGLDATNPLIALSSIQTNRSVL